MDINEKGTITIQEIDENGFTSKIYEGNTTRNISSRDLNNHEKKNFLTSKNDLLQQLIAVFLPTGYPYSVSDDYANYQIYDSIQAFSSSIAGLFANRCVLSAVGVGDESATSTSALFMKVIQETVGRLGTILFAWKYGSTLEPEAKKYRYVADLVNDTATIFECLSPVIPGSKNSKIVCLCIAGLLKSICGVFAGGSRAALTLHFTDPIKGSIGDVNAKDQSQETVITLMGMLVGSMFVGVVKGEGLQMWVTVISLLSVHLWTNYQAVWYVVMRTLNRQRCNIVFSDIVNSLPEFERAFSTDADTAVSLSKLTLNPKKVAVKEKILEPDGLLRWYGGSYNNNNNRVTIGKASYGDFESVLKNVNCEINELLDATDALNNGYIISFNTTSSSLFINICLIHNGPMNSDLKSWVHALLIAREITILNNKLALPIDIIKSTKQVVDKLFNKLEIEKALELSGWELEKHSMQKHPYPSISLPNINMNINPEHSV